jgi:hypothetical protein
MEDNGKVTRNLDHAEAEAMSRPDSDYQWFANG